MDNLRGSALMVLAMAGFALEDMFIKRLAVDLPVGQILILLGTGGAVLFGLAAASRGQRIFTPALLSRPVLLRNLGELIGTLGFVTALALTPLASASAILQATPLAVTLGAAVFLNEKVGWRRWSAILVGFAGVIMIIRPGLDGFQPASLFAVQAVIGLAIRDLATRATPPEVTSLQLSSYGFATVAPAGALMLIFSGNPESLTTANWRDIAFALLLGVSAYYAIVAAMRVGEVSFVTPFRYTRLIFALIIAVAVFGETPDALTLTGACIIIASGLYTLVREQRVARRN